jgi:hypothetical protein
MDCAHCHREIVGRPRRYCEPLCKWRGYRRRRAGLPEDHLAGGGRRGRVPLAGMTKADIRRSLAEIKTQLGATTEGLRAARELFEQAGTSEGDRLLARMRAIADERLP